MLLRFCDYDSIISSLSLPSISICSAFGINTPLFYLAHQITADGLSDHVLTLQIYLGCAWVIIILLGCWSTIESCSLNFNLLGTWMFFIWTTGCEE